MKIFLAIVAFLVAPAVVAEVWLPGEGNGLRRQLKKDQNKPSNSTEGSSTFDKKAKAHKERQQLKSYFEGKRNKVKVLATTVTESGQVIDWIDPASQLPPGRKLSKAPPDYPLERNIASVTDLNGTDVDVVFELEVQPHARGPEGTVPVIRRDTIVDRLKDEELPDSVDDFLSRYGNKNDVPRVRVGKHRGKNKAGPKHRRDDEEADQHHRQLLSYRHKFVSTEQEVFNGGGEGYINVWRPTVATTNELSEAQVIVSSGTTLQTIEVGWHVFPSYTGDTFPHLYLYYTTNEYAYNGDSVGGYNLDVDGFVQYSTTVLPGARITPSSTYLGTQRHIKVRVVLYQGDWWVVVNGVSVGYYPGELFDIDGLQGGATAIGWSGHVADVYDGRASKTRMGSGYFASKGYKAAAYMKNLLTYSLDVNYVATVEHYTPDYITVTNSKCYSSSSGFNSGTTSGSYFYFGGPGAYSNAACNTE